MTPITTTTTTAEPVRLRPKPIQSLDDEDKPMRRVSYLRATANESNFNIESDFDSSPASLQPSDTQEAPETPELDEVPTPAVKP